MGRLAEIWEERGELELTETDWLCKKGQKLENSGLQLKNWMSSKLREISRSEREEEDMESGHVEVILAFTSNRTHQG